MDTSLDVWLVVGTTVSPVEFRMQAALSAPFNDLPVAELHIPLIRIYSCPLKGIGVRDFYRGFVC